MDNPSANLSEAITEGADSVLAAVDRRLVRVVAAGEVDRDSPKANPLDPPRR